MMVNNRVKFRKLENIEVVAITTLKKDTKLKGLVRKELKNGIT